MWNEFEEVQKSEESREFEFHMVWESWGKQTVKVPKNLSDKEALDWVKKHLNWIPLPTNGEYVEDSCEIDEESEYGFND